jgi:hypothetical protein
MIRASTAAGIAGLAAKARKSLIFSVKTVGKLQAGNKIYI